MKVLVLGATGFVGQHLAIQLFDKLESLSIEQVTFVGRSRPAWLIKMLSEQPKAELLNLDMTVENAQLPPTKYDWVINVVAFKDWSPAGYKFNSTITKNALRWVKAANARGVIHISSLAVLGERQTKGMVNESALIEPDSDYGRSKAEAEGHFTEVCKSMNAQLTILRPALILGAGSQSPIAGIFKIAKAWRVFPIFSFPPVYKAWTSVDRLAEVILRIVGAPPVPGSLDVVHLVEDENYTYTDLWKIFCRNFGSALPLFVPKAVVAVLARFFRLLGRPVVSLEKALVTTTYDNQKANTLWPSSAPRRIEQHLVDELSKTQGV